MVFEVFFPTKNEIESVYDNTDVYTFDNCWILQWKKKYEGNHLFFFELCVDYTMLINYKCEWSWIWLKHILPK